MKRAQRLTRTLDFQALYTQGTRVRTSGFVIYGRKAIKQCHRLGLVASRKIGNAVERNRLKRRLRTLYPMLDQFFQRPTDVVVIAIRPEVTQLSFSKLSQNLCLGFKNLAQRCYAA